MDRWPALLTLSDAANYLGVGETVIKQLRASEQISSVKIREKLIRFRRVDLDKFIEQLPAGGGEFPAGNKKRSTSNHTEASPTK